MQVDLHLALKELVDRMGPAVLDDPGTVRGVLDDVLDESIATVGDLNLLVDAVRLGAVPQLQRALETGADPMGAVAIAGATLARNRGGADPQATSWACAVLGFARGWVPEEVVLQFRHRPAPAQVTQRPGLPDAAAPGSHTWASPTIGAQRPGAAPAPVPAPESRRPLISSLGAAVASLVLIAAGAAGVAAAVLLNADDPDPSTQQAQDPVARTSSGAGGSSSADTAGESDTPAEHEGEDGSAGPTVTCWDGDAVNALARCSFPDDVAGLVWVFPESDADGCSTVARGRHGRVVDRYCSLRLAAGGEAQLHYSQWFDFDRMRTNYRADQVGPDLRTERADLHAFAVTDTDAEHKVVLFFRLPDAPWSVTVYATSATDMDAALQLLQIRPVKQLRGVGRQQQHLPTSFRVMAATDG